MWKAFRRLLTANPMGIFIYSIMTKWYLTIAVGGLVVAFWVFKGLEQAGVLSAAQQIVTQAISDSKSVAKFCVPKIADLHNFWDCLQNLPEYSPEQDETSLQSGVDQIIQNLPNGTGGSGTGTSGSGSWGSGVWTSGSGRSGTMPNVNPDPYYDNGN